MTGARPPSDAASRNLRDRYFDQGYLLVEGVFDVDSLSGARRILADVPDWIRGQRGQRNVQRAQPLQTCAAIDERSWLSAFYDNAALTRILAEVFGGIIVPTPRMSHDFKLTGLLIEPLDHWWSTGLHRDYRDFIEGLDVQRWQAATADRRLFNQINIPLLPDDCVWVVPGSQDREDTAAEARLVAARSRYSCLAETGASEARSRRLRKELIDALTGCGAVNLRCGPGDFLLYRSSMLHCGVYEPGIERMTLHDAVYSDEWRDFALTVSGLRPGRG